MVKDMGINRFLKSFSHKMAFRTKLVCLLVLVCLTMHITLINVHVKERDRLRRQLTISEENPHHNEMPEPVASGSLTTYSNLQSRATLLDETENKKTVDLKVTNQKTFDLKVTNQKTVDLKITNQKIYHIGFLKVHKAGSSTMQNIFFRFGLKHNLTFVIPNKNNYILPEIGIMPVKPGHHYDILTVHSNYSKELFGSLLPIDSVNIGIVRKPLDRMISAAYYYRDVYRKPYLQDIPKKTFIKDLIAKSDTYEKMPFSYTKNAMGRDFGFSPNLTENDVTAIKEHLNLIKGAFRYVLVMEMFEESLILMKRLLNWDLSDILFLRTNHNSHEHVNRGSLNLAKFKHTCFLDFKIYSAFSFILEQAISREGASFQHEVNHFKNTLSKVSSFCATNNKQVKLVIPTSKWSKKFAVLKSDCDLMNKSEGEMLYDLRNRHNEMNM